MGEGTSPSTENPVVPTSQTIIYGALGGVAIYNALELLVFIAIRFRRYGGLYFWSLLVTVVGIILWQIGFFINIFSEDKVPDAVSVSIISLGWLFFVNGQSIVLYSRLGMICRSRVVLRVVAASIAVLFLVGCVPTMVLTFGVRVAHDKRFQHLYSKWEIFHWTAFPIQETLISSLYVFHIRRMWKEGPEVGRPRQTMRTTQQGVTSRTIIRPSIRKTSSAGSVGAGRNAEADQRNQDAKKTARLLRGLVVMNVVIVVVDLAVVIILYSGYWTIHAFAVVRFPEDHSDDSD
jgi:hypothetical protein